MSGIAGIFHRDGSPTRQDEIEVMISKIAHRGPDGCNIWKSDSVAFVNCKLNTTHESLGEQLPFQDVTSQLVIAADARIDNRRELIDRLRIDRNPRDITDSRIILESYKTWGKECPVKLIGDFAFAIWDSHRKQLFCARDHIGTRPFFYYICDKFMVFSSEIQGILSVPEIPTNINDKRVADYLNLIVDNNAYTFFENIHRLQPATSLLIDANKKTFSTYWRIGDVEERLGWSNAEYAEEFKCIFFEAVRCRLRSVTPVGFSFSGGLDSSAVLSSARQLQSGEGKLSAFSFNFEKLPCDYLEKYDEREFQQAVIAEGGVEHYSVNGNQYKPFEDLDLHLQFHGEPFFFPHLYLNWRLWIRARKKNINVMLDGLDGDSVISHGYEHLQQLALNLQFPLLLKNIGDVSRVQNISRKKLVYLYFIYPFFRGPLAHMYKSIKEKFCPLININEIINKDFALQSELPHRARRQFTSFFSAKKMHHRGLTNTLLTSGLEYFNNFTARLDIENRSPFFDRRVMELCFSLPSDQKLQNGWSRYILREAMKGTLVENVRTRVGKSNLTPGFIYNLLKNHRELVDEVVHNPHAYLRTRIDSSVLQKQWAELQVDAFSCSGKYHLNIYNNIVLNAWLNAL